MRWTQETGSSAHLVKIREWSPGMAKLRGAAEPAGLAQIRGTTIGYPRIHSLRSV